MKIIALTAENIKRLVAVEIRPDGNLVQISGKNGQGKTSVLDSIWWALAGAKHIQAAPIRKGANHARIKLDLGEILVTRTFQRDRDEEEGYTTKLEVVGKVKGSPQAMLDSLLGSLTFDPLRFARMDEGAQFNELKAYVPDVDFAALAAADSIDTANRKELNRRAKESRILADQIEISPKVPAEPVDESALLTQLTEAGKHNSDVQLRAERRKQTAEATDALEKRVAELRKEADEVAARLKGQADELENSVKANREKLAAAEALPAIINVEALQAKIQEARELNRLHGLKKKKLELEKSAASFEVSSKELTNAMALRESQKIEAIAKAKLPIEALSLGNSMVMLNGVPFNQASDAEQLRASCALAMAGNPELRVIRVRDGSLLDEDSMKILAEMAKGRDYQVWIERVGAGNVGFILEDGRLADAPAVVETEGTVA